MFRITNRVYAAEAFPTDCLQGQRAPGYTPPTNKFRAGILRTRKGTVLIYPNGKAVVNKCRTLRDAEKTVELCADVLGILLTNVKLVNIAACGNLGQQIQLEKMWEIVPKGFLELELHAGLLFYVGNVSVIMYCNGNVMFVGNKSYNQYRRTKRAIMRCLSQYINK